MTLVHVPLIICITVECHACNMKTYMQRFHILTPAYMFSHNMNIQKFKAQIYYLNISLCQKQYLSTNTGLLKHKIAAYRI